VADAQGPSPELSTEADLVGQHMDALYTFGKTGRIDGGRGPAPPILHLTLAPLGHQLGIRWDVPDRLAAGIADAVRDEPVTGQLVKLPARLEALMELVSTRTAGPSMYAGPAFLVPRVMKRVGRIEWITNASKELLFTHFGDWGDLEEAQPIAAIVKRGRAVAICYSARTGRSGAEAGVETAADFRGRGLAPRVVAAWAAAVQARGLVAMYSTSWENLASQAVARKLNMTQYATDFHVS